ncbi:hypothetical protein EI94DRAFT_528899 [Lactarius quietus]|nr:hypothetical protein EI94DRAFT_528899 [Lactarius quietus]
MKDINNMHLQNVVMRSHPILFEGLRMHQHWKMMVLEQLLFCALCAWIHGPSLLAVRHDARSHRGLGAQMQRMAIVLHRRTDRPTRAVCRDGLLPAGQGRASCATPVPLESADQTRLIFRLRPNFFVASINRYAKAEMRQTTTDMGGEKDNFSDAGR